MIDRLREARDKAGTWGRLNPVRLSLLLENAGPRVLDAGCAGGAYVRELLARGHDAYGLDILPQDAWLGLPGGRVHRGDLTRLPFKNGSFDTVAVFEVLEHVPDADAALAELRRVTRGNLILSVPDCEEPPIFQGSGLALRHWVDRSHVQFFTEGALRSTLAAHGFAVRRLEKINFVRPDLLCLTRVKPACLRRLGRRLLRSLGPRDLPAMTMAVVADKIEP